jgi:hypothetical protein
MDAGNLTGTEENETKSREDEAVEEAEQNVPAYWRKFDPHGAPGCCRGCAPVRVTLTPLQVVGFMQPPPVFGEAAGHWNASRADNKFRFGTFTNGTQVRLVVKGRMLAWGTTARVPVAGYVCRPKARRA